MSIILDISGKIREKSERELSHKAWGLGEALATPSFAVEKVLSTKPNELVVLTIDELEQYIFDELYYRTNEGREVTPEYILSLQYIAKNIATLSQNSQSPYVHDAIEQGDYKQAGDNAVFGYIYFVGKRKNPLSKTDYVHLAVQCYLRWYDRNRNGIGFIVATHVEGILNKIPDWSNDMMRRAPAFSVVSSRV